MGKYREKGKEEREKQKGGKRVLKLCRLSSPAGDPDGPIDNDGDACTS
jgi:hypothetical protein